MTWPESDPHAPHVDVQSTFMCYLQILTMMSFLFFWLLFWSSQVCPDNEKKAEDALRDGRDDHQNKGKSTEKSWGCVESVVVTKRKEWKEEDEMMVISFHHFLHCCSLWLAFLHISRHDVVRFSLYEEDYDLKLLLRLLLRLLLKIRLFSGRSCSQTVDSGAQSCVTFIRCLFIWRVDLPFSCILSLMLFFFSSIMIMLFFLSCLLLLFATFTVGPFSWLDTEWKLQLVNLDLLFSFLSCFAHFHSHNFYSPYSIAVSLHLLSASYEVKIEMNAVKRKECYFLWRRFRIWERFLCTTITSLIVQLTMMVVDKFC